MFLRLFDSRTHLIAHCHHALQSRACQPPLCSPDSSTTRRCSRQQAPRCQLPSSDHGRHRTAWYAPLVGPFLCPSSRAEELAAQLAAPLAIRHAVVDSGAGGIGPAVDAVAADERLILRGVEIALPPDAQADAARRAVSAFDAPSADRTTTNRPTSNPLVQRVGVMRWR